MEKAAAVTGEVDLVIPKDVIEALAAARRLVVAGHVNPDLDSLGSMLALARAVPTEAVAVTFVARPTGRKLGFMLDLAGVAVADEQTLRDADAIAVVDTGAVVRAAVPGDWATLSAGKCVVNIDHHVSNGRFGTVNWVVDHASSTSELICQLILAARWKLDAKSASLLYAGIHADTAGFSLPTVRAETFDAGAALLRAGADIEHISSRLWRSQGHHEFDLLRTVYHNMTIAAAGQIAYSTLSHDEIIAAGCTSDDIDEQVMILSSLAGVRMALLFSEAVPGIVRINLRGNGHEVLSIAQALGGGGHRFSAGVRIRDTMESAVSRVLRKAQRQLAG